MATIDNYTIDIKVNGDQQIKNATATADNLGKSVNNLHSKELKQLSEKVTESGSKLDNLSEKFDMAKGASEKFIATLSGFGAIGLVTYMLQSADATDKLAKTFGITLESALELTGAFSKIGIDTDGVARTFQVLAENIERLKEGDTKVIQSFRDLGISFKDLQNMTMKETILAIAEATAKAKGSTEALTASRNLLGKAFIGKDPQEFVDTLKSMIGTQEKAAETTRNLAATQENLEYAYKKVKGAFIELFEPVAKLMKEFTDNGINAKAVAMSLAGALGIMVGAAVLTGIKTLITSVGSLITFMTSLGVATTVDTVALGANTVAVNANAAATAVQLRAKVANMEASLASARALIIELGAVERGTLAYAEKSAALRIVTINTRLLTLAQAELAAATATSAAASVASTTAVVAKKGAFEALGFAIGAATRSIGAFLLATARLAGIVGAIVLAFEGLNYIIGKVFGKGPIDYFAEKLEMIVKEYLPTMHSWFEKIGKFLGMAPGKLKPKEQEMGPTLRVDISGHSGKEEDPKTGVGRIPDLNAANLLLMRQQLETLKLQNAITADKIAMQMRLIGLSNEQRILVEQTFNVESKRAQDMLALNQQIAVKKMELANTVQKDVQQKLNSEIGILQQRLVFVREYKDETVKLSILLEKIKQDEASRVAMLAIQNRIADDRLRIENETARLTMTSDQQRVASLKEQMDLAIQTEIRRREALLGAGGRVDYQEQLRVMDEMKEKYQPLIDATQKLIDKSREFATGFSQAFNQAMDDATNAAKIGRDSFNAVFNSMNNAIDNFVMTGKFKFKDFAVSIIQDLLKIELKATTMKLLGAFGGGAGAAAGGGGFFSTLFKTGMSLLGFADGGEPPVGRPSIVGERGPEVFIPKSSGTIISNNALGALGGQTNNSNTYITNNISAIDAKSVAQLFTENRRVLLGSVKAAEKELPYRGR